MNKNQNYAALKKFMRQAGVDLFGVADITRIKDDIRISKDILKSLDRAVCLGVRLSGGVLSEISAHPTKLYFHHYRTVNAFLDQAALKAVNFIQKDGYTAVPIPASVILDWEKQTAHLSHKRVGVLAGLGWVGRSNLLVNKDLGAQFRLVTILTDMPLAADKPIKDDCGKCRLCISICPAQAIKETYVDFDHMKCFEKLKEFQKQKLADQYICGVCVNVCKGGTEKRNRLRKPGKVVE